jgi:PAS domain S-box-containing protein
MGKTIRASPANTQDASALDEITQLYPTVLTRQQANVFGFVVRGRSSHEIADELVLSERTVHHHIRDVYERLGVRNRAEAVAFAFERAAEAQQSWLAAVVSSSVDAIIGRDLDGIITRWNPAAEVLYGYPAQEALGQSITMLAPPGRAAEIEQRIDRLRRGEAIPALETQRRRKDDAIIDVSVSSSPVWDIDGRIIGSAIVVRDVTQQKQEMAERDRLAAIVASADDAIFTRALDDTITSWNAAAERLFGYSAQEAIGQSVAIIIPPDRAADYLQVVAQFQDGARVVHLETVRRHKDGHRIDVSLTLSQLVDADGTVIGASAICRDVSGGRNAVERRALPLVAGCERTGLSTCC